MRPPVTILNDTNGCPGRATLVVFGHYRGGTSMMAGLLRIFGIFMGDRVEFGSNEDLTLRSASAAEAVRIILERNRAHDLWGFKDPGVYDRIHEWYHALRNPRFLCIFRDLLACAHGEVLRGPFDDVFLAMRDKQERQSRMMAFLQVLIEEKVPVLLASYERALQSPGPLVDAVARFIGFAIDEETRERAVRYVVPERTHGEPSLPKLSDEETRRIANGWNADLARRTGCVVDGWRAEDDA
ncbi:MAG: hypothetical protein HY812_06835 [Planctomycetes bacterium]|nr:hypothetical protein [Planctomycetota bacterium]